MAKSKIEEERETEAVARRTIEAVLDVRLERVPTGPDPTPDYRCETSNPALAVEVKELTVRESRELMSASKDTSIDSTVLTGRWAVMPDTRSMSSKFAPMPKFVEPDPRLVASIESEPGMKVVTAAEQEADWRRRTMDRPTPRLKDLASDIEADLAILERHGHNSTREPGVSSGAAGDAWMRIAHRTHGALCHRRGPVTGQVPGIDIYPARGDVRTDRPDTIVGRVNAFLQSPLSKNLKASLIHPDDTGAVKHAVIVLDESLEPEAQAAREQGLAFCPTEPLNLPPEIDVLWFILGPVACRYAPSSGWTGHPTPPAHA